MSIREQVLQLAKTHNVAGTHTSLDLMGQAVTYLADDDLQADDVELILVRLRHKNIIDQNHFGDWLHQYLKEQSDAL